MCSLVRDLGVPSQVTVQGDTKVTLNLTGLIGPPVNLVAHIVLCVEAVFVLSARLC